MNEATTEQLSEWGRKGGEKKTTKTKLRGFGSSGLAKIAGSKGGRKNAENKRLSK